MVSSGVARFVKTFSGCYFNRLLLTELHTCSYLQPIGAYGAGAYGAGAFWGVVDEEQETEDKKQSLIICLAEPVIAVLDGGI